MKIKLAEGRQSIEFYKDLLKKYKDDLKTTTDRHPTIKLNIKECKKIIDNYDDYE